MSDRPSDEALWRSVDRTLRDVVLPQLADPWARQSVIGLIGLAAYARGRGDDPADANRAAVAEVLDTLSANRLVARHWPPRPHMFDSPTPSGAERTHEGFGALAAAGAVLAAAVTDPDDDGAASEVRAALRPLLVAQLDAELASDMVLSEPFRGRLPGA